MITDEAFDAYYPMKLQKLSATHWTPVAVAKKAVDFLCQGGHTRILDLGSGAGKFCIVAAMNSQAHITGVEQRANLVLLSRKVAARHGVANVEFIHSDLIDIDFGQFDAFYFFNSFEEKINLKDKIDSENHYDQNQYEQYCNYLLQELEKIHIGARLVTYCVEGGVVPDSYTLVKSTNKGKLLFWVKSID